MLYKLFNGHMPVANTPIPKVAISATFPTLLQLKANASASFKVKGWGVSFDGSAAATPIVCELVETGTIAATVTAHVAADVFPFENAAGEAWIGQLGTAASGFTSTAEGTITASRVGDMQLIAPTNQYLYDWVLSNEFQVQAGHVLRVRITGTGPSAICYVLIEQ